MWKLWFIIVCVVLFTTTAMSSYATTINATSCAATDVQSAINTAVTGDLVVVPSGNCNWGTSSVSINGKNITVQGAGVDVTTITATGAYAWRIGQPGSGNSSRITGFTVIASPGMSAVIVDGDGWRIDHMKLQNSTSGLLCNGVFADGLRVGTSAGPTGLVDHISFIDCRMLVYGFPDVAEKESSIWVSPLGLGNQNAVYIEDSDWTFHGQANLLDCNYGGRWVLRFSTTVGSSIDSHSNQGWRSCRRWEIYNNAINFSSPYFTPVFIRGGTGTIFGNTIASGWGEPYISFDNTRSYRPLPPLGRCDGTAPADGNQHVSPAPDPGWPCRDQIGWNTDTFKWTAGTPNPPQLNEPAYIWSNTIGGSPAKVNVRNGVTAWIQANRDYYIQDASFDGTTGVGVGTIASRPSSCTTGVAYWATDEGEWDSRNAGGDGQLYKCTSTNTWKLYYRPYTYPHPLQTGVGLVTNTPPAPPTNIIIR